MAETKPIEKKTTKEKAKIAKEEKPKKEKAPAKDRNEHIDTPCTVCGKVFVSYNSMTSHRTRAHSKDTETYKKAHQPKKEKPKKEKAEKPKAEKPKATKVEKK